MKVSVVIPCWNFDKSLHLFTIRCIESIRETSDAEVVVVDNGSTIGVSYLQEEADKYIRYDTNKGYTKAINKGFEIASHDYLIAGNNDYQMTPGWSEELTYMVDNIPQCGIACLHTKGGYKFNTYWQEKIGGGWWMIKRQLWDDVGGFDEKFINSYQDYDFNLRMKHKTGKWVVASPKVTIVHYGEATRLKDTKRHEEELKSLAYFGRKWSHIPEGQLILKVISEGKWIK